MRTPNRRTLVVAFVAGAALAASVASAVPALRTALARQEAALEARVLDSGIRFLDDRVATDPHNHVLRGLLADRYAERFQAAADMDDLRRATEQARRLVADRPDAAGSWIRLARVLLTQHRFPEAFEAAARAVRLAPEDDAALGAFVDVARANGAYPEADSALARISDGSTAEVLRTWRRLVRDDASERAMRGLRRVCARFDELGRSRDVRAWCRVRLADAAILEGRRREAKRWLDHALRIQPDHRGALETGAGLALEDGDWSRAARLFERIITPAHPDIYLSLSKAYRGQGRDRDAERAEARFLRLATAPGALNLNALFLAEYYADGRRDCNRASELVRRELQRRPSIEVLSEAARISDGCGDPDAAERLRARAVAISGRPGVPEAFGASRDRTSEVGEDARHQARAPAGGA